MYTSIAILISYDPRTQIYPPKLSDNYFSVFKRALNENYGQCCVCYTGSFRWSTIFPMNAELNKHLIKMGFEPKKCVKLVTSLYY